ncbi:MAG: fibronectin type III domain-containing protein [Putridiphycobacter sp.]
MRKIYLILSAVLLGTGAFAQGDDCATAVPVTPGTYTADGPSTGGGAVGSGTTGTNADWYSFTPTCSGTIDVASCDGGADTKLYIFDGTAGCGTIAANEIAVNDDACQMGPSMSAFASQLNGVSVTAGTTYYIEWTDRWDNIGFDWNLTFTGTTFPGVAISNITFGGADLNWSAAGTETSWDVEYGPAGFTQGSGTVVNVNTTPALTISGLSPETTYDVYITDPLDPCTMSMTSFTTLPLCPVPTAPMATPGANDAALSWTAGGLETMWDVEWGSAGFVLGSGTLDNNLTVTTDNLTGLTTLTDYHWYVRAVCDVNTADGVDTVSLWVGPESFQTLASCVEPNTLNATVNSFQDADLDWTAGALETEWEIEYGVTGYFPGTGTSMVTTSNPVNVTGLTEATTYDYYVRGICGAGDTSIWVGPFTFTTPIACPEVTGVAVTPGALDAAVNWTAGGTETEWNIEYGAAGFTPGSGTTQNVLTTPTANITGLTADTQYDVYIEAVCGGANGNSTLVGPITFTTASTCNVPSGLSVSNILPNDADLGWTSNGVETEWEIEYGMNGFTQGSGTSMVVTTNPATVTGLTADTDYCFYVRAICGAGDTSMWVGPSCFTTTSSCPVVSGLGISNLTPTSTDLNWTAGGLETEWNVEYGVDGFTPGSGTVVNVTGTPTTNITGLTADSPYDFYVTAICGAGDSSMVVGPYSFNTAVSCPQPTNLNAINITTTAANLLWQAGGSETDWNVEWGATGFMPGTGAELGSVSATTDNPYYATGLNTGTTYEFYVQASCGAGDESVWSGPYSFSTLCGVEVAPYMQDFDAALAIPNCWSTVGTEWGVNASGAGGPGWGVSGAVDHTSGTGNFAWIDGSGGIDPNELHTPMIDMSALTQPEVGFWFLSNNTDNTAQNEIMVQVEVSTGLWATLGTYSGNNANWVEVAFDVPASVPSTATFRIIQIETATGSAFYNDLLIDDFFVREKVPCVISAGTPTGNDLCLSATASVELFDAITGYTDGNGTWYYPDATTVGAQAFAASNGSLELTGLTPGTPYTFDYVVSGCDNDTVSVTVVAFESPMAGGDGTLTDCNTGDVFLLDGLTGTITTGGTWSSVDATANAAINGNTFEANGVAGNTVYAFDYIVANGTCADTATVSVTLNDCLGLDETEASALEVYPNPVSTTLTIGNLNIDGNATITLVDMQGKVVYTNAVSNLVGNFQLDMSAFENGVYFVRVTTENSNQEIKVVKQ